MRERRCPKDLTVERAYELLSREVEAVRPTQPDADESFVGFTTVPNLDRCIAAAKERFTNGERTPELATFIWSTFKWLRDRELRFFRELAVPQELEPVLAALEERHCDEDLLQRARAAIEKVKEFIVANSSPDVFAASLVYKAACDELSEVREEWEARRKRAREEAERKRREALEAKWAANRRAAENEAFRNLGEVSQGRGKRPHARRS